MANISKIKILNGTTYDLMDPNAARASDLGGISFALSNANALLVTHENDTITAATDTTLEDISDAIGDLADIWEAAVAGDSGSDTETVTNEVVHVGVSHESEQTSSVIIHRYILDATLADIIDAASNGKIVMLDIGNEMLVRNDYFGLSGYAYLVRADETGCEFAGCNFAGSFEETIGSLTFAIDASINEYPVTYYEEELVV